MGIPWNDAFEAPSRVPSTGQECITGSCYSSISQMNMQMSSVPASRASETCPSHTASKQENQRISPLGASYCAVLGHSRARALLLAWGPQRPIRPGPALKELTVSRRRDGTALQGTVTPSGAVREVTAFPGRGWIREDGSYVTLQLAQGPAHGRDPLRAG